MRVALRYPILGGLTAKHYLGDRAETGTVLSPGDTAGKAPDHPQAPGASHKGSTEVHAYASVWP